MSIIIQLPVLHLYLKIISVLSSVLKNRPPYRSLYNSTVKSFYNKSSWNIFLLYLTKYREKIFSFGDSHYPQCQLVFKIPDAFYSFIEAVSQGKLPCVKNDLALMQLLRHYPQDIPLAFCFVEGLNQFIIHMTAAAY